MWAQGEADLAIQRERLWEALTKTYDINVQCWCVSERHNPEENRNIVERIRTQHSDVYSR